MSILSAVADKEVKAVPRTGLTPLAKADLSRIMDAERHRTPSVHRVKLLIEKALSRLIEHRMYKVFISEDGLQAFNQYNSLLKNDDLSGFTEGCFVGPIFYKPENVEKYYKCVSLGKGLIVWFDIISLFERVS